MAITSIKTGSSFTTLTKYDSFLAGNPAFNPSSYESIATVTGNGTTNTYTFSSIPSTYVSLQLRFNIVPSTAGGAYYIRLNGDTAANYSRHGLLGNGSAASASGAANTSNMPLSIMSAGGAVATYPGVGIVDLIDYASTTKNKTLRAISGYDNNSTGAAIELDSGSWRSTSAVTSLTFYYDYNIANGSTIALYGIKG